MTSDLMNKITNFVVIIPWIVWLVWELVILWYRKKGIHADTISQRSKKIAFLRFGALAYFWGGMTAHYFFTWKRPTWDSAIPAIAFWVIGLGFIAADFFDPYSTKWPDFIKWLRWPPVIACIGLLAGYLLFPQPSTWTP